MRGLRGVAAGLTALMATGTVAGLAIAAPATASPASVAGSPNVGPGSAPDVAPGAASVVPRGSGFVALSPLRLYDTRTIGTTFDDLASGTGPIKGGASGYFPVYGRANILTEGMASVVLNVTAVSPTADTVLTVYPANQPRPATSNLNVAKGAVSSNLVVVKFGRVSGAEDIRVFNKSGSVDVIADIVGYFPPGVGVGTPTPARIMDTRPGASTADGQAAGQGPLQGGVPRQLQVSGRGGVPTTGVAAVVLNVTGVQPTSDTFATVWPSGSTQPRTSNLNLRRAEIHPNLVVSKVGPDGRVVLGIGRGSMHMVVDVQGWIPGGPAFTALEPGRLLDTRGQGTVDGIGNPGSPVGPGQSIDVPVAGRHGIPATGVSAVVLNVTAVQPSAATFLTAHSSDSLRPATSAVNVVAGETRPNLVVAEVGTEGRVRIYNRNGTLDIVADVVGWFASGPPVSLAPGTLDDGVVGQYYSVNMGAAGGTATFCDISVVRGSLPSGMGLDADTDENDLWYLRGRPWVAGDHHFTLRGDCGGTVTLRDYTLTVRGGPLSITSTDLQPVEIDQPGTQQLEATGGTGPYTWKVVAGSLPSGVTLSSAGVLRGATPGPFAQYPTTIRVTDSAGAAVARSFSLFVNETYLRDDYTDGVVGQEYPGPAPFVSGHAPFAWSVGSTVPPGLSLSPSTGQLTGTPTSAGTFSFVVTVQDADGKRGRLPVTVIVTP